jgi:hypothetical protein
MSEKRPKHFYLPFSTTSISMGFLPGISSMPSSSMISDTLFGSGLGSSAG